MYVIKAINVRDAIYYALNYTIKSGKEENTRMGKAWVAREPVTIKYEKPKQHVLIDKWRDANPFFHLMEAMWMLAGRKDGAFLDSYIKDFSAKYGEDGIIPDAYGYRWRHALDLDQLDVIIGQLKKTPNTRQAVLQMWGAGRNDLLADKNKPCNLVACFQIRDDKLDLTVYNRSNDLVFGCCGANAVHFPILQEYVASMLGIEMGCYWQVTNNLHLYDDHYKKLYPHMDQIFNGHLLKYQKTQPLMNAPKYFEEDLNTTMEYIDMLHNGGTEEGYLGNVSNQFLINVVVPMAEAHCFYRNKDMRDALDKIEEVTAEDWQTAGRQWLERRVK
jgi:thymidylate synthase